MPPKRKKHVNKSYSGTKEVLFREDEVHHYALALKVLGDRRFTLLLDDGSERIGKLRGNMRRSQFVCVGTYVLVAERMEGDAKVDIFHKYPDPHVKMLRRYGELDDLQTHHVRWQRDNGLGGVPALLQHADDDDDDDLIVFDHDDDLDALIDIM